VRAATRNYDLVILLCLASFFNVKGLLHRPLSLSRSHGSRSADPDDSSDWPSRTLESVLIYLLLVPFDVVYSHDIPLQRFRSHRRRSTSWTVETPAPTSQHYASPMHSKIARSGSRLDVALFLAVLRQPRTFPLSLPPKRELASLPTQSRSAPGWIPAFNRKKPGFHTVLRSYKASSLASPLTRSELVVSSSVVFLLCSEEVLLAALNRGDLILAALERGSSRSARET
jgi:hypothetical protein